MEKGGCGYSGYSGRVSSVFWFSLDGTCSVHGFGPMPIQAHVSPPAIDFTLSVSGVSHIKFIVVATRSLC